MRTYVFIDAENHYLRATHAVKQLVPSKHAVQAFAEIIVPGVGYRVPKRFHGCTIWWDHELQLFWDCRLVGHVISNCFHGAVSIRGEPDRCVYVCSVVGDDEKLHEARVAIRDFGFEPIVVNELKVDYKARQANLENYKIIEKPKGCDIALATRMVADAAADLYDICCLFTSDADFLPAVEAVRRLGKVVIVGGFKHALQNQSPYLYVPDCFVELDEVIALTWQNCYGEISRRLRELGDPMEFPNPNID